MRLTIPHFLDCKQCKSPPIGGCKLLPVVNEWDDSTGPNMPPIYDLILDQDGELLIQMVEAIDASDAWNEPISIHNSWGCIQGEATKE